METPVFSLPGIARYKKSIYVPPLILFAGLIEGLQSIVQCTNGKCPKACHTSCALLEYSGIFLDASYVEKGVRVSLLEEVDLKPVVASLLSREENVGEGLEDDDDVKITVLCRSHNPVRRVFFSYALVSITRLTKLVVTGLQATPNRTQGG